LSSAPSPPLVPTLAVGAVARAGGALLLVRRSNPHERGRWSLPGGKVEPGELLSAAVERETAEETGLAVSCGAFVGWAERIGPTHHFVILDFEVAMDGAQVPVAGGDAAEVAWVPLEALGSVELVSGLEDFLRRHGVIA